MGFFEVNIFPPPYLLTASSSALMASCEEQTKASTWLITGCSRGIGLECIRQLSTRLSGEDILIATCRSPRSADQLERTLHTFKAKTHILQLDIIDEESVKRAVRDTEAIVGERGIDYLLSNAAIILNDNLTNWNFDECMSIFKTCVAGPTLVATHFIPLVSKSREKVYVNFSSNLGSVTTAWNDIYLSYSMAKSAVNMLVCGFHQIAHRSTSDLLVFQSAKMQQTYPAMKVVNIHPGWVKTDLGGPDAQIETTESVEGMLKVLQDVTNGTKETARKFWVYDGTTLPF
ncbi:uncharacterized protein EI90DRAFT_2140150 [Cantharellus anzutake]|uniref:uncharacterized protein n=1 Tax=Cantharellus anzutake TaxID=1750568 RepID=UPI0019054776|nr:uncharacterized protein EI90DRAFT_2140150 [Cantharellus anzutake]KAF8325439.1 hypothetical protein EI90DRAFT_2140150 [Cantharellus anzutake]